MDINGVRSLFTLWVFVSFILVLYIVFHKRNRKNYDEAASSIFDDEENTQSNNKTGEGR